MLITFTAYILIPVYTLLFVAGSDWFTTNFSVLGNIAGRNEAFEAVKEARAQGDLSENFEYYAAKKDKNKNESRIRYLERMIRTAKVISDDSKEDEIRFLREFPRTVVTILYVSVSSSSSKYTSTVL